MWHVMVCWPLLPSQSTQGNLSWWLTFSLCLSLEKRKWTVIGAGRLWIHKAVHLLSTIECPIFQPTASSRRKVFLLLFLGMGFAIRHNFKVWLCELLMHFPLATNIQLTMAAQCWQPRSSSANFSQTAIAQQGVFFCKLLLSILSCKMCNCLLDPLYLMIRDSHHWNTR